MCHVLGIITAQRKGIEMNNSALLKQLQAGGTLDLYQLYLTFHPMPVHQLLSELQKLKQENQLSTKLSHQVTQAERAFANADARMSAEENLRLISQELDLQQRAHSMSRYIQLSDNHRHFTPQVELVMFGDSITEWGPWADALPQTKVANRGLAGDTTRGMLGRIDTTTNVKPKLICVMAGINDLAQGYTVSDVFENYSRMLEIWKADNIAVIVQSTLHVGIALDELNAKVFELNQQLQKHCTNNRFYYLDLNKTLAPTQILSNTFSCDDLHLNANAYQIWLDALAPMLSTQLDKEEL